MGSRINYMLQQQETRCAGVDCHVWYSVRPHRACQWYMMDTDTCKRHLGCPCCSHRYVHRPCCSWFHECWRWQSCSLCLLSFGTASSLQQSLAPVQRGILDWQRRKPLSFTLETHWGDAKGAVGLELISSQPVVARSRHGQFSISHLLTGGGGVARDVSQVYITATVDRDRDGG